MDWLFDNPIGEMRGPDFLVLYGAFACMVLAGAYFFIQMQDGTGKMSPPMTPSDIDPYELAYLRGGVNEVIRTAIYSLRQQGLVEAADKGHLRAIGAGPRELAGIERRVFDAISPGPAIASLFKSGDLRIAVENLCAGYRRRLSAKQLLAPEEVRRAGYFVLAIGGALLIALAAYKTSAAIAHGRSNLGFLFIEVMVSCFLLFHIFQRTARGVASKRGKAFLSQVQLAYSDRVGAAFRPTDADAGLSGSALLMVGLFGFAILKSTPDEAFAQEFVRATSSGGDGGGGCGGGGGGGGCGGCGGGGGD